MGSVVNRDLFHSVYPEEPHSFQAMIPRSRPMFADLKRAEPARRFFLSNDNLEARTRFSGIAVDKKRWLSLH